MQTLLLDWSGTLVDDFTPTLYASNEVFKAYGLPEWSAEEFRKKFYLPYPDFYKEILPEVPLDELEVVFRKAFVECSKPVAMLEHSYDFLVWAKSAGIQLIILTSMDSKNFESQARDFGVWEMFDDIYSGVLNKCETIPEIVEKHNLNPAKTAFVGDMEHDLDAAHFVGMQSVAVLTGYDHVDSLVAREPNLVLNHIGKLRQVIEACR